MNTLFPIVFLLVNVFAIGVLAVLALQYWRAHRAAKRRFLAIPSATELPTEVKQRLLQAAELDFQNVLNRTGHELQRDQLQLADHLNDRLDKLGNAIVDEEMKRYRAKLYELTTKAKNTLENAQTETQAHQNEINAAIEKRRSEIEAQLLTSAQADRDKLREQLDVKLSDAVMAFLMETLRHGIDIGAQRNYLLSQLEEHKQELIGGVIADDNQEVQP